MSLLEQPGDLAEVPLAAVLIEALNQRATGMLTVEHGGGASRVYLRRGMPAGSESFSGFKPLGQALLEAGLIDVETLGRSLAEIAATGRPQGEVLVGLGAVTGEQVHRALCAQQATYLRQIASLTAGRFRFDPAVAVPPWADGVCIAPLRAIVDALERPQAAALVIAALQPVATGPVTLAPGYRHLEAAFGWSAAEAALVARLRSPTTLEALFADPGIAPERARATVAALLLLDLASGRQVAGAAVDSVPGLVVDLVDVAGAPATADPTLPPVTSHPAAPSRPVEPVARTCPPAAAPSRRSDPEEARRRRQRLLQRAMQNMGIGPLAVPPPARKEGTRPDAGGTAPPSAAEAELRRALEAAAPRTRSADLFERLGLPRGATRDQVKAAYFQLAKQLHPDRFASPTLADVAPRVKDLFAAVNEAYEVLSHDRRRAEYLSRAGAAAPAGREQAELDFQKAEACARTRDFPRARGFYESALRGDPRPEYQVAYAWTILQDPHGDRARARALAESALREPACLDRAALVGAVLARDDGDDDRAEGLLRRALAANPRNGDAERELRSLEARRGRSRSRPPGKP